MKWDNVYDEQKNIPTNEALQWGIPVDEVSDLGVQLSDIYNRIRVHVGTQTRDTSE